MTNSNLTGILNDLAEINNDRIKGYEKAAEEITQFDIDLKVIFTRMADESRKYRSELAEKIAGLGGELSTDTTTLGKIYRTWMDIKSTFTNKDRQSVLNSCEFGEDAAQKAYDSALKSDTEMDADTRKLILDQKESLKSSHDLIKKFRDVQEAVSS